MFVVRTYSNGNVSAVAAVVLILVGGLTVISLIVSWYVYDLSGFYDLNWLESSGRELPQRILNINAGFDETSGLLAAKFNDAELIAFDFYDPERHTEASIKRARKAYPPFPGTRNISSAKIPEADGSADRIFVILSAHEIRDAHERSNFFLDINRVLSANGKVVVVEHLRDTANYLAYNLGSLHFHSRSVWLSTFAQARLTVESEKKITPFITLFFLNKNGIKS
ncbi:MAG: methyltransferase [Acidobacteriota bacterium]